MSDQLAPGSGDAEAPASAGALAAQLAAAQAELEFQGRQQQALSFGISHDLRAPLRAIDSFAGLLARHAGDVLDETAAGYLQRIRDASTRIGALLDGLNDLSLAGRAPLRSEQVDLSMLADWVGAELRDTRAQQPADISVAPDLGVQGDERYLKLMLSQLLDNAWKFSRSRECIHIAVEGEVVGDRLQLRVRDQGIGFDMQYADRVFEPFRRLHGVEDGAGAGLGLAIAQCIAQRHGGSIRAESEPGRGSVLHIELPRRTQTQEHARG